MFGIKAEGIEYHFYSDNFKKQWNKKDEEKSFKDIYYTYEEWSDGNASDTNYGFNKYGTVIKFKTKEEAIKAAHKSYNEDIIKENENNVKRVKNGKLGGFGFYMITKITIIEFIEQEVETMNFCSNQFV